MNTFLKDTPTKVYNVITYNRDIKYAFLDFLRAHSYEVIGVSGYYFDAQGNEGYYIEFKARERDLQFIDDAWRAINGR